MLVWKADSRSMNPTLSRAVVAAAYVRDAASAKAEYGAEFRDDVEDFLSLEVVEAAVIPGRRELLSAPDRDYSAFCDPSGGRSDSFTLAIAHAEDETAVLDCLREAAPPFSPEEVVREFADVLKRYGISEVTGDRYAGEWPREQFAKRGITYRVAARSRSEIYLEVLPLLTSGRAQLLDNKRLVNQLTSLERRAVRGGRDSVDHAPGQHDDCANSAAGALTLVLDDSQTLGVLEWVAAGGPLRLLHRRVPDPTPTEQVEALMQRRLRAQPVERPALPSEPVRGCPKCRATCVTTCSGQLRCNQCGHQWWQPGTEPDIPRVTRGDILNRGFPRLRRLK